MEVQEIDRTTAAIMLAPCAGLDAAGSCTVNTVVNRCKNYRVQVEQGACVLCVRKQGCMLWVDGLAGHGHEDMTAAAFSAAKRFAHQKKCTAIGFQTMRRGLVRKCKKLGFEVVRPVGRGFILECEL
jgi:LDH2 family malate/lactate/ureidoglycolate dehydrogenase